MKHLSNIYFLWMCGLMMFAGCSKNDGLSTAGTGGDVNLAGSLARFAIAGNTMYCVTDNTLNIYDLTNTSAPVYINKFTIPNGGIETVFARDTATLFVGTTTGMYIIDIRNRAFPSVYTLYSHVMSCDPVVADTDYAYVTLRSGNTTCARGLNQLEVIDISNLNSPMLRKTYLMVNPHGLGIQNNRLMVCDQGLKIFDKQDPENLQYISGYDAPIKDVIPLDSTIITVGTDGFKQFRLAGDSLAFISSLN